jgi:hypothetical protein
MAKKFNTGFQLVFPENLRKDTNLSTTSKVGFDDLGAFVEEREKIKRLLERNIETELRVDYSDFSTHVFFDSAQSKFGIASNRVLNQYPFNGTLEEKEAYELTGSGYENYIFDAWPKHVGYAHFNGVDQYITASDYDRVLVPGSSSIYVSAWAKPNFGSVGYEAPIIAYYSGSGDVATTNVGWILGVAWPGSSDDPEIKFSFISGTLGSLVTVSASIAGLSASFKNYAGMYDAAAGLFYVLINDQVAASSSITLGPLEFNGYSTVEIASSSFIFGGSPIYEMYSGSLNEIRVLHTASVLWHQKNYSRPIHAFPAKGTGSLDEPEDYLKLYYKFNEGITETGSIDNVVVDYSKNGIHGLYAGYDTTNSRLSGAMLLNEPGDPILYDFHSRVVDFSSSIAISASLYDNNNNNFIYNMIPEALLTEDENAEGLLIAFSLAMARFFDEIKLYVDQFDNLKSTNYSSYNDTPDLFLPYLKRYFGWKVTEHFGDTEALPFLFGENVLASGSLDIPLSEIRNQFWRRILNNLPYLMKTKGKRHNLDAFFNVLGINRENIILKEYGYLPGGSIEDTRIHKEKVAAVLGFGTGSLGTITGSYVKSSGTVSYSGSVNTELSTYTVETLAQFPFISASYSGTLTTGSIWQFVDPEQLTGSFTLLWALPSIGSSTGKFILTGSDGQSFSTDDVEVFDGDFVSVAAGLDESQLPFIEVRTIDNDEIDFSASFIGSTPLSGIFTGSKFDFVMGANSGSVYHTEGTQGFYGEYRFWTRALSGSELDDHAFHFESVGIYNPHEEPHPLVGHWALNEDNETSTAGELSEITDLSRQGMVANGAQFPAGENPYQKFLIEYNYLSPSVDLKWTENKIRIRNKTEITLDDVASDTNEVSLEFNLVDALNEDISKIFSTFDVMNNVVGAPVNKYRDEYSDLENIRKAYFDRLGDSLNFTNFFKLFKWFDKKLSDSIKQLLPARVKFVGGEQVVESHFLERPRYGYKYPIFRTPQEVPELGLSASADISGAMMQTIPNSPPATIRGTAAQTFVDQNRSHSALVPRPIVDADVLLQYRFDEFFDPDERIATTADERSRMIFRDITGQYPVTSVTAISGSAPGFSGGFSIESPGGARIFLTSSISVMAFLTSSDVEGTIEFFHRLPHLDMTGTYNFGDLFYMENENAKATFQIRQYAQLGGNPTLRVVYRNPADGTNTTDTVNVVNTEWNHYLLTFRSGVLGFLLNGQDLFSAEWYPWEEAPTTMSFGQDGTIGYPGQYDEFRVSTKQREGGELGLYAQENFQRQGIDLQDSQQSLVISADQVDVGKFKTNYADGDSEVDRAKESYSFFQKETAHAVATTGFLSLPVFNDMSVDSSGALYLVGSGVVDNWVVLKGHLSASSSPPRIIEAALTQEGSWSVVDDTLENGDATSTAYSVSVGFNDEVYVYGYSASLGMVLRRSDDYGATWDTVAHSSGNDAFNHNRKVITIYNPQPELSGTVIFYEENAAGKNNRVMSSSTGLSGTFVEWFDAGSTTNSFGDITPLPAVNRLLQAEGRQPLTTDIVYSLTTSGNTSTVTAIALSGGFYEKFQTIRQGVGSSIIYHRSNRTVSLAADYSPDLLLPAQTGSTAGLYMLYDRNSTAPGPYDYESTVKKWVRDDRGGNNIAETLFIMPADETDGGVYFPNLISVGLDGHVYFAVEGYIPGTNSSSFTVYESSEAESVELSKVAHYTSSVNFNQMDVFQPRDNAFDYNVPRFCFAADYNQIFVGGENDLQQEFKSGAYLRRYMKLNTTVFQRDKVSGDDDRTVNNPNVGVNWKNEYARKLQQDKDRDNE